VLKMPANEGKLIIILLTSYNNLLYPAILSHLKNMPGLA